MPRKGDRIPIADRLWAKTEIGDVDECWEWGGAKSPFGHGRIQIEVGLTGYAHRVAWEDANGPIPDEAVVRHLCNNPGCVNPNHLALGTHQDNVRDAFDAGTRGYKSHCKHGHPYSGDNLGVSPTGRRYCRACVSMWNRTRSAKANTVTCHASQRDG